jgi:UDP-N-acetylglucosamine 4,6-dehydratase
MINNACILITGGTGSFGKKMVQIVLSQFEPRKLIILSRDELKQFEMSQKYNMKQYPCIRYILGDVRDKDKLCQAFSGVDYVIHAAALKQVSTAEYNPEEFIKTNVLGAMNVIDACLHNNVKRVIALSTDKACNPINLYGATKLCADKLFTAANVYAGSTKDTRFAVVRYGNVLGSRGSVVPFFKERVQTGVLPITDTRMTRFWITLNQAVHFVLASLRKMKGGEIFVPRIPSMRIVDLAKAIGPHCRQEVIGVRPGEKIHEVLLSEDEARSAAQFKECFIVHPKNDLKHDLFDFIHLGETNGQPCPEGFTYTSENNTEWLNLEDLRAFVEKISDDYSIESSRWSMDDVPEGIRS